MRMADIFTDSDQGVLRKSMLLLCCSQHNLEHIIGSEEVCAGSMLLTASKSQAWGRAVERLQCEGPSSTAARSSHLSFASIHYRYACYRPNGMFALSLGSGNC